MLWECEECGRSEFCDPMAGDDWEGEPRAIGPDCLECVVPMGYVNEDGTCPLCGGSGGGTEPATWCPTCAGLGVILGPKVWKKIEAMPREEVQRRLAALNINVGPAAERVLEALGRREERNEQ